MSESERRGREGVEYENVGRDYMEQRELRKGAAGGVLLAGRGVDFVFSGGLAG